MKDRTPRTVLILMLCVAVPGLLAGATFARGSARLIHQKNSLYYRIFVYQTGSVVSLQFGKRPAVPIQSQVNLNNLQQHMLDYTMLAFCGLLYKPQPNRLLVLGLGGGVIPRQMRYYFAGLEIDVVEIDPDIPPIAKEFFRFREDDKLKVHIDDGRVFIKKQLARSGVPKYDIIILDAFNSDYIPFHLTTKEFLEQVKGLLADDGVVVANVFYDNRFFDAQLKTFISVFGRCQVFRGSYSTNAMIVALAKEAPSLTVAEAVGRAEKLHREHGFTFNLVMVARCLRPETRPNRRAIVLTDDRAPVNRLRAQERNPSN